MRGEGRRTGRDVAGRIDLLDAQRLALLLRGIEGDGEGAIGRDRGTAKQGAVGRAHVHRGAGFPTTAQAQAVAGHAQLGRRARCGQVGDGQRRGRRQVAGRIGLLDGQVLAIELWAREGQAEGAVGTDQAGAEHGALGITHVDGRARLAGTGEGHAIGCQLQGGRCNGRGDVRRRQRRGGRSIARSIGLHHGQGLAILLGAAERHAEGAIGGDGGDAQDGTRGITDGHPCAGFAQAGESTAVVRQLQAGHGLRCGDIGRDQGRGRRAGASGVGLHHAQRLAVELGAAQGHAEAAIGTDHGAAQDLLIGTPDSDGVARLPRAGQGQAIGAERQAGRGFGGIGPDRRKGRGRWRDVAGHIGLLGSQCLTFQLCAAQRDGEGAVGAHHGGAQDGACGVADGDGRPRFAQAAQAQAIGRHLQRGWRGRRGDVGHDQFAGRGGIACSIGLGDRQGGRVQLGTAQNDAEGAIGGDRSGAQDVAIGATDGHGGAGFAGAGHGQTIGSQGQACGCLRRGHVGGGVGGRWRGGAVGVGLHGGQGFTVELRAGQGYGEGAVGAHGGRAQHGTVGGTYGHGVAGLAGAGQGQAVGTQGQPRRRVGRIGPDGRKGGGGRRDVAGGVGLVEGQ